MSWRAFAGLVVPAQTNEMNKLNQKRKMAHSMAVTHGGRASDLESESKLSSTEELIRELLNTGQRIYAAQLSIVLKAPATADGAKELRRAFLSGSRSKRPNPLEPRAKPIGR